MAGVGVGAPRAQKGDAMAAATLGSVHIVRRLHAMNTDIELRAVDPVAGAYLAAAARAFSDVERRFSRFLAASELSRLNARTRHRVHASAEMLSLLARALNLHHVTGGTFDPSILPELEASGYDRSFELITGEAELPSRTRSVRGFANIEIDHERGVVTLPRSLRIDLGGIGKGWAVDKAAQILAPCGDYLVNAGGDVFASGSDGYHGGWSAAVEHPYTGGAVSTVVLRNQAIATSTTTRRQWMSAGEPRHHLVDPRTGACARSGVASASVIAATTVEADVFAKTALILGEERGCAFLRAVDCPGLFILRDGSARVTADWPAERHTEGGPACSDAWR
jgi:thiamine biosynthesis lipoprotein